MKIFIIGYMASGKTRFGKRLASALGLSFIDLDEFIAQKTGRTPATFISEEGEDAFRQVESEMLEQAMMGQDFVMSTGGGTPCFMDNLKRMNDAGITLWLNTPLPHIIQRLDFRRGNRPMVPTKDELIDKEALKKHYQNRLPYYKGAKVILFYASIDDAVVAIREIENQKTNCL